MIQRQKMVKRQLLPRAIHDSATLDSMSKVPRHLFVPSESVSYAYEDSPLQIGCGQTISQPYIVALMAQSALLNSNAVVLEIGTGSGYGAAVLSHLCSSVYTIERVPELAKESRLRLQTLGYENVYVKLDDGTLGWPEHAPYDAILVTASSPTFPQALIEQLKEGGRLIVPVGSRNAQNLIRLTKTGQEAFRKENLGSVRFVPLIGEQGWPLDEKGS
nr:protein-L-isoaspartate(D-aspartate) O-methyltransferase [Waddlia chondrophila]